MTARARRMGSLRRRGAVGRGWALDHAPAALTRCGASGFVYLPGGLFNGALVSAVVQGTALPDSCEAAYGDRAAVGAFSGEAHRVDEATIVCHPTPTPQETRQRPQDPAVSDGAVFEHGADAVIIATGKLLATDGLKGVPRGLAACGIETEQRRARTDRCRRQDAARRPSGLWLRRPLYGRQLRREAHTGRLRAEVWANAVLPESGVTVDSDKGSPRSRDTDERCVIPRCRL